MVETSTLNLWGSWLKDESPQYISYDGFVPTNKCVEVEYHIFQYENLNTNAGFLWDRGNEKSDSHLLFYNKHMLKDLFNREFYDLKLNSKPCWVNKHNRSKTLT